jgi:hypothetical protein
MTAVVIAAAAAVAIHQRAARWRVPSTTVAARMVVRGLGRGGHHGAWNTMKLLLSLLLLLSLELKGT